MIIITAYNNKIPTKNFFSFLPISRTFLVNTVVFKSHALVLFTTAVTGTQFSIIAALPDVSTLCNTTTVVKEEEAASLGGPHLYINCFLVSFFPSISLAIAKSSPLGNLFAPLLRRNLSVSLLRGRVGKDVV